MISENKKKAKTLGIMLVLALAVLFTFQMNPVLANIPEVTSIEHYTSGVDTYLNITVEHASPDSTHYVDQVTIYLRDEILGEVDERDEDLSLGPQSTETFFVQYEVGVVDEYYTPNVRAKGFCTTHGEGSWSSFVNVPEFSTLSLLLILAIASIAVLLFRSKARACVNK
ncbi:MAG: hypothetical protein JSV75_06610 [Candidatus Bathyarchaeota archaeon]|nr:MAG: hypothetical protein JSV75_06610 [Candidatus Bathyarchaeota archaeon]